MLLVALVTLVAGVWPVAGASGGAGAVGQRRPGADQRVDFNGDGISDLAVGAPGENSGAGAVNVLYGSPNGLAGANQTVTQAVAEAGDSFGAALAKGDFNGDQITDLAVGAPGEGVGGAVAAGAVSVFYGSQTGLGSTSQVLLQANPEVGDQFGEALDAGGFDADVNDDLAVGAPGEGVGGRPPPGRSRSSPGRRTGWPATAKPSSRATPRRATGSARSWRPSSSTAPVTA